MLYSATWMWLEALTAMDAITEQERDEAFAKCRSGLEGAGAAQSDIIASVDPVNQFFKLVGAALQSGEAHLANLEDNGEPRFSTSLGWRVAMIRTSEGLMPDCRPQGDRIGWIDSRGIFLIPEAALNVVQRLGSRQGASIPWGAKTLGKRLMEAGKVRSFESGRTLQKIRVAQSWQRALHLAAEEIVPGLPEIEPEEIVIPFNVRGKEAS